MIIAKKEEKYQKNGSTTMGAPVFSCEEISAYVQHLLKFLCRHLHAACNGLKVNTILQ